MEMNDNFDKFKYQIESSKTGILYETKFLRLNNYDLININRRNGWKYNWKKEMCKNNRDVYKLMLVKGKLIHGLISLEFKKNYLLISLVERAPFNKGKYKRFNGVPYALVNYAAELAFFNNLKGTLMFKNKKILFSKIFS